MDRPARASLRQQSKTQGRSLVQGEIDVFLENLLCRCPVACTKLVSQRVQLCSCGKPGKLQCPKCLELQLPKPASVFCSQECFKVQERKPLLL